MNEEDYEIEKLENTFKEHAEKYDKEEMERRKKYEEEYKEPYPYPFFSLCRALHVICEEINQLKKKTEGA